MQLTNTKPMKRYLLLAFIITSSISQAIGNNELVLLESKIDSLQTALKILKSSQATILQSQENTKIELSKAKESLIKLQEQVTKTELAISETADKLGLKISNTEQTANDKISQVDKALDNNTLLIGGIVLLTIIVVLVLYRFASNRQKTDKTDFEKRLDQTKRAIEEEQVQINTKLAELYNGQMEMLRMERKGVQTSSVTDHSLALKVADEVVKMQMNLSHMDPKVRGHRQLSIAVSNVFDNFRANGYEITDLLNKPFVDGMNMEVTMEPSPTLQEGEKIITRIIKPEVYFNEKIIQNAKVIVSYGE